jgi:hypothetical protein
MVVPGRAITVGEGMERCCLTSGRRVFVFPGISHFTFTRLACRYALQYLVVSLSPA